ncbi:uncharacterized protein LOC119967483 isoform X2 [Scyliorhinus canicula]|uniref:uncharacterized protein LOC119967483 isoform X2 n=1 Tax=Scyliorhinus canicula TaxID=7830 RepID=UPI0018F75165|nr:uncharacterized protein LOC119967483 isoform X2 [Scyliorhinus canicula]
MQSTNFLRPFDGRWWISQKPRKSIQAHRRSNFNLSYLETFTTIITNEFQESTQSSFNPEIEMINRQFFELFINPEATNQIDLEFLNVLVEQGANVNSMDKNGCTVLHEVARNWSVDVAVFLVERGADVNHTDIFGRSALHVAAAANNVQVIKLLIENEEIDQVSDGDMLTPMHCAAKHDALEAVVCLHVHHANIHRKDFKKRTPLFLAAAHGYNRTAMMLLKLGASATVEDNSGFSCLMEMIIKMPTVAKYALDQLHIIDETGEKQHYYLKYLLTTSEMENKTVSYKTLLEVVLINKCYAVVEHPVLKKLIDLKWKSYGLTSNGLLIFMDVIFIFSWVYILSMNKWKLEYDLSEDWFVIALSIFCIMAMLYVIYAEMNQFLTLRNQIRKWKNWRRSQILQDQIFCHPRWPQEEINLKREIAALDTIKDFYFLNWWNIHDCIALTFLSIVVFTFIVAFVLRLNIDIFRQRIIAISLIPLWLKNLKHLRAFRIIGPFIVTIIRIMVDVAKFFFLYFEFYFAYAYTYWLVFGGTQELKTLDESYYFVFRISVKDDWNRNHLEARDLNLSHIITGTHIGLTSILCFSVFVALMNNAYIRIHENLNANVLMERVNIILQVDKNWATCLNLEILKTFIEENCAPLTVQYDRMRNRHTRNTFSLGGTKSEEEKNKMEPVWRIKEMVNNCTNIITGIPNENEAESMTNLVQRPQQSKSKKLVVLQTHLQTVQQEMEVLQSRQKIIYKELENDMDRLQEVVQKVCELHRNRGLQDQVPDDKKLHSITLKEKFLRNKMSTANIYLKRQLQESRTIFNQDPFGAENPHANEEKND